MSKNKKESQNQSKSVDSQPLSPLWYAFFGFIVLIISMGLLFFIVLKANTLVSYGFSKLFVFVIFIALGVFASLVLFGAMRSYGHYKGKQFNGILELGGPIVLFIAVVGGGFYYVTTDAPTFPLTVYVHGSKGKQDFVLKNQGKVVIDLGGDRRSEDIGPKGQAYFPSIPATFRNQEVLVTVDAQGFELKYPNKLNKLSNTSLYVEVKRDNSLARIRGIVRDEKNSPLKDVAIRIGSAKTTTDEEGFFILEIPPGQQKKQQNLTAFKQGYNLWEGFVFPGTGQDVKIILIDIIGNKQ